MSKINKIMKNFNKVLKKSSKKSNTHDILLHQANIMVHNDNRVYLKNLEFGKELTMYLDIFEMNYNVSKSFRWIRPSYSAKPDAKLLSAFTLFSHHFYNVSTNENYFNRGGKTALCKFKFFTKKALEAKEQKNKQKCMRYISYACHYLADLNEPHHVSDKIAEPNKLISSLLKKLKIQGISKGVFSNHRKFEYLARSWLKGTKNIYDNLKPNSHKEVLLLTSMPTEGAAYNYLSDKNKNYESKILKVYDIYNKNIDYDIDDYCEYLGVESAKYARRYINNTLIDYSHAQSIAAIRTLNMAEIQIAKFLYYFFTYKK